MDEQRTTRALPRDQRRRDAPQRSALPGVGTRVREARERAGLTGADLGTLLGLDKSQVSKIESDRRRISVREMPKLAQVLRVTPQWILGTAIEPSFTFAHRLSGSAETAHAQTRAAAVLKVASLLEGRGLVEAPQASPAGAAAMSAIRERFSAPPRTREEAQRQGRQMAAIVREELKLGIDELGNLADLIETHFAADVVLSPLGTDADGLCAHTPERAVIVASTSFDAGHVRFTLAHELGHHLLNDPREVIDEVDVDPAASNLAERRVSSFAAHLLLPHDGVSVFLNVRRIGRADFEAGHPRALRATVALVGQFGISVPATVFQLAELGLLSDVNRWMDLLEDADPAFQNFSGIRQVTPSVRPPRRLIDAALDAAASMTTGTGPLSVLLEQPDEDQLYKDFVAPHEARASAPTSEPAGPAELPAG